MIVHVCMTAGMQDMLRVLAQPLDASQQQQQDEDAEGSDDEADILQPDSESADEGSDTEAGNSEDDSEQAGTALGNISGKAAQTAKQVQSGRSAMISRFMVADATLMLLCRQSQLYTACNGCVFRLAACRIYHTCPQIHHEGWIRQESCLLTYTLV